MSEMVERVAGAIRERMDQLLDDTTGEVIDTRHIARAAIAAMREPTEGMARSGDTPAARAFGCFSTWQAMIDEALK